MRERTKGFTTKDTKSTKGDRARFPPILVIASRGFCETAGGSRNFVPARAGLDPAIHAPGYRQRGGGPPGHPPAEEPGDGGGRKESGRTGRSLQSFVSFVLL